MTFAIPPGRNYLTFLAIGYMVYAWAIPAQAFAAWLWYFFLASFTYLITSLMDGPHADA